MTAAPILSSRRLVALTGVLVTATCVFALLWALALAPDQADRLASIRRLTALSASAPARPAVTSGYPSGAVCGSGLAPAEALFRIRLSDAAKAAGTQIVGLELVSAPGEPLSSVQVTGRVEGPYGSGLNFMKILADQTPTVFIDRLKVSNHPNDQTVWDFSGRIYCSVGLP